MPAGSSADSAKSGSSANGVRWKDIRAAEPEFAARVEAMFGSGRHKTLATLRRDGSPRISGIECEFTEDELQFGSMPNALKAADLHRDPRFALHGPPAHPAEGSESDWPGEAKIAGRAVPAGPIPADDSSQGAGAAEPAGEMFTAAITEVVVTGLSDDATRLVVESWTPQRGRRRIERD